MQSTPSFQFCVYLTLESYACFPMAFPSLILFLESSSLLFSFLLNTYPSRHIYECCLLQHWRWALTEGMASSFRCCSVPSLLLSPLTHLPTAFHTSLFSPVVSPSACLHEAIPDCILLALLFTVFISWLNALIARVLLVVIGFNWIESLKKSCYI